MSYKTNFQEAGPVQVPIRAKVRNLAGITESQNPNAANPFSSALANTNHTAHPTLPSIIDPRLLSMSNADFEYPGRNVASSSADQSSFALQLSFTHNSRPRRSKAANSAATVDTRELSTSAEPEGHSASVVDSDENIRWKNGVMEWHDDQDFRWKPARYHRDCRAELITDAAQLPGAPIWTPDMGVDYTSFSPLTQGWNSNPSSVVDSQGRQVFRITEPPENWLVKTRYGPLVHRGCVLLDHKNKPVRDIPGLPVTLSTDVEGWLLGGLRRCIKLNVEDFTARFPPKRVLKSKRLKDSQGDTSLTQKISRFLEKNKIPVWHPRTRKTRTRKKRPEKAEVNSSGMETDVVDSEPHLSGSQDMFPSSWEPTPFVDLRGHAAMGHPPIPEPYPSLGFEYPPILEPYPSLSFEYPPPSSAFYFGGVYQGMRRVAGGHHVDHNALYWEPNNYPGMPVPFGGFESLPANDPFVDYHPSGDIDTQHNLFNAGGFQGFQWNER